MIRADNKPTSLRTKVFVSHLRDGYRALQGRGAKHTLKTRRVFGDANTGAEFDFDQYTVSDIEWELLQELVKEAASHEGPIVEIGVLAGRTTHRIAAIKQPHQKILAVDNFCWNPWGLSQKEHLSLVRLSFGYLVECGHVEIHQIDKNDFYAQYDGPPPSLVFADAAHDYDETKKDLIWAKEAGAKIICGHDYSDQFPGVKEIVDELGGPRQLAGTVFRL